MSEDERPDGSSHLLDRVSREALIEAGQHALVATLVAAALLGLFAAAIVRPGSGPVVPVLLSRVQVGLVVGVVALLARLLAPTARSGRRVAAAAIVLLTAWAGLLVTTLQSAYLLGALQRAAPGDLEAGLAGTWEVVSQSGAAGAFVGLPAALVLTLHTVARWRERPTFPAAAPLLLVFVIPRLPRPLQAPLLVGLVDAVLALFCVVVAARVVDRLRGRDAASRRPRPRAVDYVRAAVVVLVVLGPALLLRRAGAFRWLEAHVGVGGAVALPLLALFGLFAWWIKRQVVRALGDVQVTPLDLTALAWADAPRAGSLERALAERGFAPAGGRHLLLGGRAESWFTLHLAHDGARAAVVTQARTPGPLGEVSVALARPFADDRRLVTTDRPVDGLTRLLITPDVVIDSRPGATVDERLEAHERDATGLAPLWGPARPLDLDTFLEAELRGLARRRERLRHLWAPRVALTLLQRPRGGRWPGPLPA